MSKANFFELETLKLRDKCMKVLGKERVCSTDANTSIVLCICWLSLLSKEISDPKDNGSIKEKIKEFARIRNKLDALLEQIKKSQRKRRCSNAGN